MAVGGAGERWCQNGSQLGGIFFRRARKGFARVVIIEKKKGLKGYQVDFVSNALSKVLEQVVEIFKVESKFEAEKRGLYILVCFFFLSFRYIGSRVCWRGLLL